MDWTIKPYPEANHPPVPELNMPDQITVNAGDTVKLSATGSSDPDGNSLSYSWFYYKEPGTFSTGNARTGQPLKIENSDKPDAYFVVPVNVLRYDTMHIILAVSDNGTPRLTRYRCVVVTIE